MFDDVKVLLDKATEPGDMATILIAGTIGFVADAALHLVGFLSPGYCGIAAASTALGVKKSFEASRQTKRVARAEAQLWKTQEDRASKLHGLFVTTRPDLIPFLDREIGLLKSRGAELASVSGALDDLVKAYRQPPPP